MGRNRKKSGVGSVKQDVNQVFPAPVDTAYPYSDGTYYDLYAFSQAVQEMIIGGGIPACAQHIRANIRAGHARRRICLKIDFHIGD